MDTTNAGKTLEELLEGVTDPVVAIQRMVQGAIERLHDRTEDWVPEALRGVNEDGEVVSLQVADDEDGLWVTFRVLMTDISKEIDRNEQATKMRVADAEADTVAMLSDVTAADVTPEEASDAAEKVEAYSLAALNDMWPGGFSFK